MSTSPINRPPSGTKAIPIRRVVVQDPSDMPSHCSATPGGTLYSTTPGGTRIVYERNFLMNLRNSPISKTPPAFDLPGALLKGSSNNSSNLYSQNKYQHSNNYKSNAHSKNYNHNQSKQSFGSNKTHKHNDESQFEIDL